MLDQGINLGDLSLLFRREFVLCNLRRGETVILLTDQNTPADYIAAAFAAASDMGADSYSIGVSRPHDWFRVNSESPGSGKGMMAALKSADLVVTFFPANLTAWSKELRAAGRDGPRMLLVGDSPQQLARLISPPGLKQAVLHATRRWSAARTLRVVSDAGTDMTWQRGEDAVREYYGFADEPGRYDMWGGGHITNFPDEGTANGTVVISPGDIWILPYVRLFESEVRLEVRDGFIRKVTGGLDAKAFTTWLDRNKRSEDDMDPYAVSHLGFGLHPNAHWDHLLVYGNNIREVHVAARAFAGNFLFSTGPSNTRKTKGHIDTPMCDCTVYLDNEMVLERGRFVDPRMVVTPTEP
jgi:2,5-dihydroxypyridine 5,6-dioxygenase